MKRSFGLGLCTVAVAAILVAAVGCGASHPAAPTRGVGSDLLVLSHWHSKPKDSPAAEVSSGALASDPRRGFVLVEQGHSAPSFFTTSARHGPLRLISSGSDRFGSELVFAADGGWTAAVEIHQFSAQYYELGRRLDPEHLPALPQLGIAVPIVYGPRKRPAVLLVGDRMDGTWVLYGFLPGFELPAASDVAETLHRPLLGPHDVLYRIDRGTRRLVSTGSKGRPARFRGPGHGCSSWPQVGGSRYLACSDSIKRVSRDGGGQTVFRQPPSPQVTWPFLAVSPDGRALLLEEDFSSCGTNEFTDLVPLGSGVLVPILGGAEAQPLGWLPFKRWEEALVAGLGAGSEDCGGAVDGIYDVYTLSQPSSERIVATNVGDATTW